MTDKEQGLIGLYCIYANTLLDKFHNSSSKKQSEEWVALDTQDGHSLQPNHHRHEPLEDDVWGENRVKQNWTLGKGQSGLSLIWTGCRQRHMHPIHWKIEFNAMIKWRRGTVLIIKQRCIFLPKTNISAQTLQKALHKNPVKEYRWVAIFLHQKKNVFSCTIE